MCLMHIERVFCAVSAVISLSCTFSLSGLFQGAVITFDTERASCWPAPNVIFPLLNHYRQVLNDPTLSLSPESLSSAMLAPVFSIRDWHFSIYRKVMS